MNILNHVKNVLGKIFFQIKLFRYASRQELAAYPYLNCHILFRRASLIMNPSFIVPVPLQNLDPPKYSSKSVSMDSCNKNCDLY